MKWWIIPDKLLRTVLAPRDYIDVIRRPDVNMLEVFGGQSTEGSYARGDHGQGSGSPRRRGGQERTEEEREEREEKYWPRTGQSEDSESGEEPRPCQGESPSRPAGGQCGVQSSGQSYLPDEGEEEVTDGTERPEDTVRRLAMELQELEAWKRAYQPAAELWDSLELERNDQVTEAVLVAKISDFDKGGTAISMGATEGCDWITQLGVLHAAIQIMNNETPERRDDG